MILLPLLPLLTGCFLVPPDSAPATESTPALPITVAMLRSEPAEGQAVVLDVVVQSGLLADGSSFYVADPEGGPRSGLRVWSDEGFSDRPSRGDRVELGGYYDRVDGQEALIVAGGEIRIEGAGEPVAAMVSAVALGTDWEDAESALVRVEAVTASAVDGAGVATLDLGARLDPAFFDPEPRCRRSWSAVVGLLASTPTGWALRPRDPIDLEGATEPERVSSTVAGVQGGDCGPVELVGVVSSPSAMMDGVSVFFVMDDGLGVQVASADPDPAPAPGERVTLRGEAGELGGHTRLQLESWTSDGTAAVEPVILSTPPERWSDWDGTLVTLSAVTVTGEPVRGAFPTDRGVMVEDLYVQVPASTGTLFSSITGVIFEVEGLWSLAPRDAGDVLR